MRTEPASGSQKRAARLRLVVLPAPDGPITAVIDRSGTTKLIPERVGTPAWYEKFTPSNATSTRPGARLVAGSAGGGAGRVPSQGDMGRQRCAEGIGPFPACLTAKTSKENSASRTW